MSRIVLGMIAFVAVVAVAFFVWMQMMHRGAGMDPMHMSGGGEPTVQLTVPTLQGLALTGEGLFEANCSACHGDNAAGRDGAGPPLIHKIYEPSHHGDMAFVLAVKNGVRQHHWPYGNMPPISGVGDEEIAAITDYVRTVQRANGIQ